MTDVRKGDIASARVPSRDGWTEHETFGTDATVEWPAPGRGAVWNSTHLWMRLVTVDADVSSDE